MLGAEHEAAEILRYMRLKAHRMRRRKRQRFRWFLGLLGWSVPDKTRLAPHAGRH